MKGLDGGWIIGVLDIVTFPTTTFEATVSSTITGWTCMTFSATTFSPSTFAKTSKCILTVSGFVLHAGKPSKSIPSPSFNFFSTPKPIFTNVWADTSAFNNLKEPFSLALGPSTEVSSASKPSKFEFEPLIEARGHIVENWLGVRSVVASSRRSMVERAFDDEDNSTSPGARRLSLSLLVEEEEDEVGAVSEVGPTMRSERSGAPWVREAWRSCSAKLRRPDANPFWDWFKGSGRSSGWRRLTDLAPLTVTTAPSANITFFKTPASTSCCTIKSTTWITKFQRSHQWTSYQILKWNTQHVWFPLTMVGGKGKPRINNWILT